MGGHQGPQQPPTHQAAMQQTGPPKQPQQMQGGAGMGRQQPQHAVQRRQPRPGQQRQAARQVVRFKPDRIEDLIQTDVVTARRDTPVQTVVASMAEKDVGSVVIVDEDGQTPVNIITDRNIALALEENPTIAEQPVESVISGELVVGQTDMTVFGAIETFQEAKVRRLPIVDDEGALRGLVSLDDLLVFIGNKESDALEVIASQIRI